MKKFSPLLSIVILLLIGCNKVGDASPAASAVPVNPKSNDALSQKLREFAGAPQQIAGDSA